MTSFLKNTYVGGNVMKICRCNKCGKYFDELDHQQPHNISGFMLYGSEHDGEWVEIDLCVSCLDSLIASCVVSPISENKDGNA